MTVSEFRNSYRYGPYAWPSGCPRFAVMDDGEALCFECLRTNRRLILEAIRDCDRTGWNVIGFDINWEDPQMFCAHCNVQIESAYGEE